MFSDERIIIQSGKIFKSANIIALLIALASLVGLVASYVILENSFNILIVSTEIAIIITSSIILLYGELFFKNNIMDERVKKEKYQFYNTSGSILLIAILLGYSFRLLGPLDRTVIDIPANHIIILLESVGIFYFYYQFKKNDININYSFIENTKKEYYKTVFKKLLKFAIIIISMYTICGIIGLIYYHNISRFFVLIIAGLYSIGGIGGLYFLLSFLEKKDYDNEQTKVKSTFVFAMLIYLGISLICACCEIYVYSALQKVVDQYQASSSIGLSEITYHYSKMLQNIDQFSLLGAMFFNISLCYLMSYFKEIKSIRKLVFVLLIMLISQIIFGKIELILSVSEINNQELTVVTARINMYVNLAFYVAKQVISLLLIIVFIRKLKLSKWVIVAPILSIINIFVTLYINTLEDAGKEIFNNSTDASIYDTCTSSIINILFWLLPTLLIYFKYRKYKELEE